MSDAQRDSDGLDAGTTDDACVHEPDAPASRAARIVVRCAGRTAVGQVRDHNEDNFVVANLASGSVRPRDEVFQDDVGEHGMLFAVCDGMGGAAAGEVASQMAVEILVEAMRRGGVPKSRDALARRLVSAVEEAGQRIFDSAQKERSRRGMGTTATVAVLVDKVMFVAEVGDSRAYLLRRGELRQLTKDQSLVNQLIEAGHLTEDEAEAFEHSNIILQALGTSESVQVDLTFVELRRGDRLMLCSDGLSGLVHSEAMRGALEQLEDPAECSAKLIEHAESAGGHDNITVVVADFDGEALADAAESDTFGYVQYPLPLSDDGGFPDEETTAAGTRARAREPRPSAPERSDEEDFDEPLLPLAGDPIEGRGNALWVLGGVLALLAAVVVWLRLDPAASDPVAEHAVVPSPAERPPPRSIEQAGAQASAASDPEGVEVNVHTDVEDATLLVNGDTRGELSPERSRSLRLRPGAYRFEAQSEGNQVAVTVVTVRGDTPMDVFLQLPKGASERARSQTERPQRSESDQSAQAQRAQRAGSEVRGAEAEPSTRVRRPVEPGEETELSASKAPRRPRGVDPRPQPIAEQPESEPKPDTGRAPRSGANRKPAQAGAGRDTAAPAEPPPVDIPENPF